MLESMGYHTLAEARKATQEELLAGVKAYVTAHNGDAMSPFSPIADGYVFPEAMNTMIEKGDFPDLPIMIGCTAEEAQKHLTELPSLDELNAKSDMLFGEGYREQFLKAIHYPEDKEYALTMANKFVDMTGGMQGAVIAWCKNQLRLGKKPSYRYLLTLVPPTAEGAHHSAEHQYVFQTLPKSSRPYTGRDWDLSNQLADYWANFIKTGNPNGEGLPEWTPYTAESPKAMKIDYDLQMFDAPSNDLVDMIADFDLKKI